MAYISTFGAHAAIEQRERAEAALEQLITDIDMPPERRPLAVNLMLVFARAEIMRLQG